MIDFTRKNNEKYQQKDGKDPIRLNKESDIPYFYYPILEETNLVNHAFSTRIGGVSEGPYTSMNFRKDQNDTDENVEENYRRFFQAFGADWDKGVMVNQTHTVEVRQITEEMITPGRTLREKVAFFDVDGMITNVPGVTLITSYADCVPLYFLDPAHKAVGLSHSGRRGTVDRMGKVTLEKMKEAFGTEPGDVIACIGPSICQDCYEVGEEVIDEFREAFDPSEYNLLFRTNERGRYQLDLWKANELILLQAGIRPEHLAITDVCTCCNHDLLFSHRYTKGLRGNLNAFLGLKEESHDR